MNSSHKSQLSPVFRVFLAWGLAIAAAPPVWGYSPQTEAVLEILRERIAAGAAEEETYLAFSDLLAGEGADGCEAWAGLAESHADDAESERYSELLPVLSEVCPEPVPETDSAPGRNRSRSKARLSVSQAVQPRRDQSPGDGVPSASGASPPHPVPAPRFAGEVSAAGGSGSLSLREYRPWKRYVRLDAGGLHLHGGHIHSAFASTRLGSVAGRSFFAGWTGTSGADGAFFSPRPALDGLGLSARSGRWTIEAAGTWNRLAPMGGAAKADGVRRDASLFVAGLAHEGGGDGRPGGLGLRFQAARQRFESAADAPVTLAVTGFRMAGEAKGLFRWRLGGAFSVASAGDDPDGPGSVFPDPERLGGFAEASLSSPDPISSWRLEGRQASRGWGNPLQSPGGVLRDTLSGWPIPGGGEGGMSSRSRFPLFGNGAYQATMQGAGGAGWSLRDGLLRESGSLGWVQEWKAWTHETGISLSWRGGGASGAMQGGAVATGVRDAYSALGQSLAWRSGPWRAKAALSRQGGNGVRPAPLNLEVSHGATGFDAASWTLGALTGDIRHPGRYLRGELRQAWKAGGKVRVGQELRLPWTPEGLAGDLGYQLRLEAAL
ncbi:MAG: hypothetical protein JWP91_4182 [Fibrobacteres bacterium]|nr:hypothetical protein [Fibrobacterota bacterium]